MQLINILTIPNPHTRVLLPACYVLWGKRRELRTNQTNHSPQLLPCSKTDTNGQSDETALVWNRSDSSTNKYVHLLMKVCWLQGGVMLAQLHISWNSLFVHDLACQIKLSFSIYPYPPIMSVHGLVFSLFQSNCLISCRAGGIWGFRSNRSQKFRGREGSAILPGAHPGLHKDSSPQESQRIY